MFKKLLSLSLLLSASFSPAFAEWELFDITEQEGRTTLTAVWKDHQTEETLLIESQTNLDEYKTCLRNLTFKEGYTTEAQAETVFTNQNLKRQEAGNPYHLLRVTYQKEDRLSKVALLQLGRMPSKGYQEGPDADHATAHHAILQKFNSLGVTRKFDPENGYADANIERIENHGVGFFLPMFEQNAQENEKTAALSVLPHLFQALKNEGRLLPVEKTAPHVIMSLFHPEDPNLGFCQAVGFEADANPDYYWFYNTPRVMVTKPLQ